MNNEVSIQPMLAVRGGARAVAFYEKAFGATVVYQIADPDGNIVARLAIGGAEFWVQDAAPDAPSLDERTFRLVLVVGDPDATYAKAVAAGAEERGGVHEAHGWRTGRVVDPFGVLWEVSKPVAESV